MSIFKKRSGMIDVVDMQKRGLIKLPARKPSALKASKDGFVELKTSSSSPSPSSADTLISSQTPPKEEKSGGGWLGTFFGGGNSSSPPTSSANTGTFSTENDGYDKREVDAKVQELDNKIYRMEQRLEVLERKNGVGSW